MKVVNISAVLLSALFSVAVSAAPLGEVSSENGKIFSGENYMVVKKDMKKGEQIKPHDHPGFKTLIFAVGKGSFDVTLNQKEKHTETFAKKPFLRQLKLQNRFSSISAPNYS